MKIERPQPTARNGAGTSGTHVRVISYRVVTFGAPLEAVETPAPQPRGGQVLLRVRAAGVCHSDLHLWDGGYDLGRGKLSLRIPLPRTLGHEVVGEVIAAGPDAHDVAPGDVRLVYPWIGDGTCAACRAGEEQLCAAPRALGALADGGYADHIIVPDTRYLIAIGDLDPAQAALLACSGLTTYRAITSFGAAIATEPVVVIGAGGLGLMAIDLLGRLDAHGAIVLDLDERKRSAALEAGARAAIDASAPDAVEQIARAAGGAPRMVIDLVGSPQTAGLAFAAVAKGGTIVVVGLFGGTAPWALPLIPLKAVTIRGTYVGSLADLRALVELVQARGTTNVPLTRRPLAEATRTLEDLQAGRLVGRAVLVP